MTDEQIIKALKICFEDEECTGCPLENNESECEKFNVWEQAFDLINRQKAEIERFEECASREMLYEKAKAEAVKEFAERLKEKYPWKGDYLYSTRRTVENIDNLVKEMAGEG